MVKTLKGLVFILASIGLFSCGSDDSTVEEASELVLYKIDYTTEAFEGGVTLSLRRIAGGFYNDIPLEVDKEPADMTNDGSIAIIYQPTLDQVFQASLALNGESDIFFPTFIEAGNFLNLETSVPFPTGTQVQSVDGDHSQVPISSIWESIAQLGLTEFMVREDTQLGLFLYQPSEDAAFSANWDWILMLYNP